MSPTTMTSATPAQIKLLIIDDSIADARVIQSLLRKAFPDPQITHCLTGAEGQAELQANAYDCVLLDYMLAEVSGLDVLKEIRKAGCRAPIITLSGCGSERVAVQALQLGAQDYIVKGAPNHDLKSDDLHRAITRAIERVDFEKRYRASQRELRQKNVQLTQMLEREQFATQELKLAVERADAAMAARSEFIARMSHELRTPLHAILGFTSGLLDPEMGHPVDAHQEDRLQRILSSGQHLLNLINDLLNIAKSDAGKLDIECSSFSVLDVFIEVASLGEALLANDSAVEIRIQCESELPELVTDRAKLQQILINLVANAIKFTLCGSVTLHGRRAGDNVVISVEDTGVGIPADMVGKIFEPFAQVKSSHQPKCKGTGLGLAICQSYSEAIGATLSVSSEAGVGSTFTLNLAGALKSVPRR